MIPPLSPHAMRFFSGHKDISIAKVILRELSPRHGSPTSPKENRESPRGEDRHASASPSHTIYVDHLTNSIAVPFSTIPTAKTPCKPKQMQLSSLLAA